jgi:hypothetical protein
MYRFDTCVQKRYIFSATGETGAWQQRQAPDPSMFGWINHSLAIARKPASLVPKVAVISFIPSL